MNKLAPPFSMENIRRKYENLEQGGLQKLVDGIEIRNSNRVVLGTDDTPVYVVNHVSHLDHVIPHYAIYKTGLPYPRTVATAQFDNWFVKLLFDFSKYGVIWHDRSNDSPGYLRSYIEAIRETLADGTPVLFHPEGGRNRNSASGLAPFKDQVFRIFYVIQDQMSLNGKEKEPQKKKESKNIRFVPIAIRYDNFPEDGFYRRMDRGKLSYAFWDLYALVRWRWKIGKGERGTVVVNFGSPVGINELQGTKKEKAELLSTQMETSINDLLLEIA